MPGSIGHPASLLLPFVRSPSVILDKKLDPRLTMSRTNPVSCLSTPFIKNNDPGSSRAQGYPLLLSCPARSGIQHLCPCPLTSAPSTSSGQALSLPPKGKTGLEVTRANIALLCHAMILLCSAMFCYFFAMSRYDYVMNCYVFCYAMLCFAMSCYDCAMFRKAGGQSGSWSRLHKLRAI